MEPNSQPQVIKQLFSSLIVENTQCTLEFLWKTMRKTKDLDLTFNWPLFRAVEMREKHLLLQYVKLYQNQKCCTTFASPTNIFEKCSICEM